MHGSLRGEPGSQPHARARAREGQRRAARGALAATSTTVKGPARGPGDSLHSRRGEPSRESVPGRGSGWPLHPTFLRAQNLFPLPVAPTLMCFVVITSSLSPLRPHAHAIAFPFAWFLEPAVCAVRGLWQLARRRSRLCLWQLARPLGGGGAPRGYPCGGEMGSHGPPQAPIFPRFFFFARFSTCFHENFAYCDFGLCDPG